MGLAVADVNLGLPRLQFCVERRHGRRGPWPDNCGAMSELEWRPREDRMENCSNSNCLPATGTILGQGHILVCRRDWVWSPTLASRCITTPVCFRPSPEADAPRECRGGR